MKLEKVKAIILSGWMYTFVVLLGFVFYKLYGSKDENVASYIGFCVLFRWICFSILAFIFKLRPTPSNLISDYFVLLLLLLGLLIPELFQFFSFFFNILISAF